MDAERGFIVRLGGGKRQTIGESNAVAREVQAAPGLAEALWDAIAPSDPLVRMRAVDATPRSPHASVRARVRRLTR